MKKQRQLSPKKYVETKARSLPVYKCWVNAGWKEAGMANVIVARQHSNQNLTVGIYLVDLKCLGIKDSFYFFNEPEEDILKKLSLDSDDFIETDYALAHNIIYSGHDFALEYDIPPHKEFALTKNILEEDTEDIPLIDVPTGDEEGKPCLIVDTNYNYKPILEKLKKNAGEGNYNFIIGDPLNEHYEEEEDDEEMDTTAEYSLNEIEYDYIDFDDVRTASDEELEQARYDDFNRSLSDQEIIYAEQMLRILNEREEGWVRDEYEIKSTPDFRRYEEMIPMHQKEYSKSMKLTEDMVHEINAVADSMNDNKNELYFNLFKKYEQQQIAGFIVLNSMPLLSMLLQIEYLRKNRKEFPPLVQLSIAVFSLSIQKEMFEQDFEYITNAAEVEDAFPVDRLHALHQKIFWVVKALHAMNHKNKEQVLRYHSLLCISGIGGRLRSAYVIRFNQWLEEFTDSF